MGSKAWTEWDDATLRVLQESGYPIETAAWYFERTINAVRQHARLLGIRFLSQREAFTADEDESIRLNYPTFPAFLVAYVIGRSEKAVQQRAKALGVRKAPDFYQQWHVPLWHPAWQSEKVRGGRFRKGLVPANKGRRRPGYAPGRMAETQFKKGQLTGAARHNYVPIGTERVKDGVVARKVTDDPTIYPARRWVPVHRLVWEAANGPVPAGHLVRFKRGQKTQDTAQITIDRLELVSLAENMRRNSVHRYPEEVVRAVQMRAALNRRINRMTKEQSP